MARVHRLMSRSQPSMLWLTVLVSLVSMPLLAQVPPGMMTQGEIDANTYRSGTGNLYESAPNTAVVIVHAFADEKPVRLDRSARADLTNVGNHLGVAIIVPAHEDAVFTSTALGKYILSISAVGYLTERQEISLAAPDRNEFDIVLRRDPSAAVLNQASGDMPKKARKEADHAVSLLKSGRTADARKHLEVAYELAPSNADLNFLFGYLNFEKKDYGQAESYLHTAASLNPRSLQTLCLLGRTNLEQRNYPAAQSAFSQAILVDPEDWLPHQLLAYTYLQEKEYNKAKDEALIAVTKSGRYGKNASAAGDQARALIEKIEESKRASEAGAIVPVAPAAIPTVDPKIVLSMQTWRPPDIDDVKPILEPGISCPSAQVLEGAGQRVQEFVQDVANFSAEEVLFHKSLDEAGLAKDAETRKYDYVAAISSQRGSVFIEEYHKDRVPQGGTPDGIGSTGFVGLALLFHPEMQDQFDFDCEGQGEWRGQPSWLVHFIQRHDRPNHMQSFSVGEKLYRIDLKGRAWISTDTFQIVHIEADVIHPVRELGLLSEHQVVQYGPVPFAKKNVTLWLPKNVDIYFDFGKRRYYRQYNFDDYMLFGVDVSESRKLPAAAPTSGPNADHQEDRK